MLLSEWSTSLPQVLLLVLVGAGAPAFALPGLLPEHLFGRGIRAALFRCAPIVAVAVVSHVLLQAVARVLGAETLAWAGPILLLAAYTGGAAVLPERVIQLLCPSSTDTGDVRKFGGLILAGALAMLPFWTASAASDNWLYGLVHTVGAGIGFSILTAVLEAVRARLETARVSAVWNGIPTILVCAGLIVLGLLGLIRPLL